MSHDDPRLKAILESPSYRLAEDDTDFLESDGARAIRLALEFHRTETYLQAYGIESTVVVFGSARMPAPEDPVATPRQRQYYEEARRFAYEVSRGALHAPKCHRLVIATGGGPGLMEAANRGASEAGAPTIGFNIHLPHEQFPNPYITPGLAFSFRYFALRKMHFMFRARALVALPGGFGTLDEVYEALNLVLTRTIAPIPIVLVGREYWGRMLDLDYLVEQGFLNAADRSIVQHCETGSEAAAYVLAHCGCEEYRGE
ncbi:MAG: LOG family protein [Steroidobacteraceae bacterium]